MDRDVKGLCVVDEIKDADGSSLPVLQKAVNHSACMNIGSAFSVRVGTGSTAEQFGFFWNTDLMEITGPVAVVLFDQIERDPGVATFVTKGGFDFAVAAFDTRPDSEATELKKELAHLDDAL